MDPLGMSVIWVGVIWAGVLGTLIGSFSNVVIYRLPAGTSIVFPGSACPACGRRLRPLELIPIVSWVVQRGRCRGCATWISLRYPAIEAIVGAAWATAAWWSLHTGSSAMAFVLLAAWSTVLIIVAAIDVDTLTIPDVLSLSTALVVIVAAATATWWRPMAGVPTVASVAAGAASAAGSLVLVERIGALVLRRGRDTRERTVPIGFDTVVTGAVAGAAAGAVVGIVAATLQVVASLVSRRAVRLPEPLAWAAWLVLLAISPWTVGPLDAVEGTLIAAGAAALAGAWTWWLVDLRSAASSRATGGHQADDEASAEHDDEPIAMGFGDVKLAGTIGALVGVSAWWVAGGLAIALGAVVGVAVRLAGGTRVLPFGPFLAVGGIVAAYVGDAWVTAYLRFLGIVP